MAFMFSVLCDEHKKKTVRIIVSTQVKKKSPGLLSWETETSVTVPTAEIFACRDLGPIIVFS